MNKLCVPVLLMVLLTSCSTQRSSRASTEQSSTIKINLSEDNVAVHAHNVRFEALVNAIYGATGVYTWETVMEFDPDVADRIVSMDFEGYRSMCTITPALESVGLCRIRLVAEGHWTFRHKGAQPSGLSQ
jgi:hypothetical protein